MKKSVIIVLLSALCVSACSAFANFGADPTPIPATPTPVKLTPTPTPDPCAPENLKQDLQILVDQINIYRDTAMVAGIADQTMMVIPILELQANSRAVENLEVPECQKKIKDAAIEYMIASINVYSAFSTAKTDEEIESVREALDSIEASLWQQVLFEVNTLLVDSGLVEEPSISPSSTTETDEVFGMLVLNTSTAGINVRELPDLDSEIIAKLEPDMDAIGIARTETSEWIQINFNGVIGWVFAETITSEEELEDLPVFEDVE